MYIISDEQWAHESNGQMRNLRILLIELCNSLICRYFNCPDLADGAQAAPAPSKPAAPRKQQQQQQGDDCDSGSSASASDEETAANSPAAAPQPAQPVPVAAAPLAPGVPAFKDFILNAVHRTRTPLNAMALALMYVSRLRTMNPHCAGTAVTPHRVMLAAVMLACKVLYDDTYSNKTWVHVSQGLFGLAEINRMEWEFLEYLRFRLVVSRGEWLEFLRDLDMRLAGFVSAGRSAYFAPAPAAANDADQALRAAVQSALGAAESPAKSTAFNGRERVPLPVAGPNALSVAREVSVKMTEHDTLVLAPEEIAALAQISFEPVGRRGAFQEVEQTEGLARRKRSSTHRGGAQKEAGAIPAAFGQNPYHAAAAAHPQRTSSLAYQAQQPAAAAAANAGAWSHGMHNGVQYPGVQYMHHPLSRYHLAPQYSLHPNVFNVAGAQQHQQHQYQQQQPAQAAYDEESLSGELDNFDTVSMECSLAGERAAAEQQAAVVPQQQQQQEYTHTHPAASAAAGAQFGPFVGAAHAAAFPANPHLSHQQAYAQHQAATRHTWVAPATQPQTATSESTPASGSRQGSGRKRPLPSNCPSAPTSPTPRPAPGATSAMAMASSATADLMTRACAILEKTQADRSKAESAAAEPAAATASVNARRAAFAKSRRGDSGTDVFAEHLHQHPLTFPVNGTHAAAASFAYLGTISEAGHQVTSHHQGHKGLVHPAHLAVAQPQAPHHAQPYMQGHLPGHPGLAAASHALLVRQMMYAQQPATGAQLGATKAEPAAGAAAARLPAAGHAVAASGRAH